MLPQNRRLRHLQGIYLRNLSFSVNRARAIDDLDADLRPNNHNNNQNNYNNITNNNNNDLSTGYSEDIHGSSEGGQPPDHAPQLQKSQSSESLRPRPNGRRRSTTLAHVSPVTRQKQLEYAVESRAADVFFSLHCEGMDDPIYISEVGERAMNFNFRFFDLDSLGPFVTRSSVLIVKIWAKRWQKWGLLLQQHVDLRSLNYIGTLRSHQFPPNCLVFHLIDGIYSLDLSSERPEPKQGPGLPSSSYNALMKLSNLDNSIQDALATRESLTAQINEILERAPSSSSPHTDVPRAQESALLASRYVTTQKRTLKAAQARQADLRASIEARRRAIAEGREAQARAEADVQHARSQLPASRAQVATTREAIRGQRRRICEDLARIFPIVPDTGPLESPLSSSVSSAAPPSPLAFRICGIPLPNTDYDPTSSSSTEDSLSAALGYVAHLADLLQYYLSVPLPYPLTPFGSRSSVRDDISLLPDTSSMSSSTVTSYATSSSKHTNPASGSGGGTTTARQRYYQRHQQRDFPLFLRGGATAQYRFDYAWFLLNKDIEALFAAAGRHLLPGGSPMRVVDLRHTLPNLKYLLYVCTAGSDDIPERKRGGVRGLWAGRMKSRVVAAATAAARGSSSSNVGAGALTPDDAASAAGSSRRGSTDSEALGVGAGARSQEQLKQAAMAMAGAPSSSTHKENGAAASSRVRDSGVGGLDPSGDEGRGRRRRSPDPNPEPLGLLPFDDGAPRLTLRTKGLRENVGAHA